MVNEALRSDLEEISKCALVETLFNWSPQAHLNLFLDCFKRDHLHCYLRPVWHFNRCPEDLGKLDRAGLERLQCAILALAKELEPKECAEWQVELAHRVSAMVLEQIKILDAGKPADPAMIIET
ncbi:MAG TPA: hypothetical protein VK171_01820 [Fimbriimonas sp.]|nr:hypothetical protein [Fimbriimonas sp.]